MANEVGRRISLFRWAIVLTVFSALGLVLWILTITSVAAVGVSVGIVLLAVCFPLLRQLADFYRRWAGMWLSTPIESPYLARPTGNLLARVWARAKDPATRRDLLWLLVNSTVGLALSVLAIVETLVALLFWWMPGRLLLDVQARISRALLRPSQRSLLARRVQELTTSRADTMDTQAAEIRRIERDLHDGAQARLVALGMNLGLAESVIESDPELTRRLLAEARTTSSEALAELRSLVRGIHPPVLADRGLVGAVQALALTAPLSVEVDTDVPAPLPDPVASAAYFVVAETLTNVIKHSGATRAWIAIWHRGDLLTLQVGDDGHGGANTDEGTGLAGIERRLAAFDGRLAIQSPAGGPTLVTMELPCPSTAPPPESPPAPLALPATPAAPSLDSDEG